MFSIFKSMYFTDFLNVSGFSDVFIFKLKYFSDPRFPFLWSRSWNVNLQNWFVLKDYFNLISFCSHVLYHAVFFNLQNWFVFKRGGERGRHNLFHVFCLMHFFFFNLQKNHSNAMIQSNALRQDSSSFRCTIIDGLCSQILYFDAIAGTRPLSVDAITEPADYSKHRQRTFFAFLDIICCMYPICTGKRVIVLILNIFDNI